MSTSVGKIAAERNHRTLLELVLKPGNDICADCRARAPRWASYNLGIFICVSCASIHRKIGTHVTKVKSITLDEWSKEQVEVMKEKGNIKSNALYNPDEARHPPPTNTMDSERDSELEKFIRSKYEYKRFMDRKPGSTSRRLTVDSHATSTVPRRRPTPLTGSAQIERKTSPGPPPPPKTPENLPFKLRSLATVPSNNPSPTRSFSQPLPPLPCSDKLTTALPLRQPGATQSSVQKPAGQAWEDLVSLQGPSQSSSLPLQYSPASPVASIPFHMQVPVHQQPATFGNAPNPFINLSLCQAGVTAPLIASPTLPPTPSQQFPLVSSASLPSLAPHLGVTNPFHQALLATGASSTTSPINSNPFSASPMSVSMASSTPTTPSTQPVMALPTGTMHTPTFSYFTPQPSTPAPALSFPPTPFATSPSVAGFAQNPISPVGAPGQMVLPANGSTNPFAAVQMGQTSFTGMSPQAAFGTSVFLGQQQQPGQNGFGGWAGQGAHGTF